MLTLDQKVPRMLVCEWCGKDVREILVGALYETVCESCGDTLIGIAKCPDCGTYGDGPRRPIPESGPLPYGLCESCDQERKSVLASGGVFWRCLTCGSRG